MKHTKNFYLVEYLSSTMIMSYFFIHNILLVLIGITFLLYLINIDFINSIIKSIIKIFKLKKVFKNSIKYDKDTKPDSIIRKSSKEESKLTLAETIEELGFIPSLEENDKNKAA